MERITGPTVDEDLHGSGKDGFTEGNQSTEAPTIVTSNWLNGVQEEIITTIEAAGLTPSGGNLSQLLAAIALLHNYAYCEVSASAHAANTDFDLATLTQRGGFALASDTLDIPATGTYLIALRMQLASSDTANPASLILAIKDGITTLLGTGTQMRFSTNASHTVTVCAIGVKALTAASALSIQHTQSPHTFSGAGDLFVLRLS